MIKIWAIGLNTFREAIRSKVLYSLLFFATLVIMASRAFGALSVREEQRLTIDLGLAGMSFFLIVIAIVVGVNLVYKELERKTVYSLLPKPLHRYQFVLGKFTGLALTLLALLVLMCAVLALALLSYEGVQVAALAKMICLIFAEVLVVTSVALFFSSFSTPYLSGMFTIGIFLLGRSVPDIRLVARGIEQPGLSALLKGVSVLVPNLRHLYVSGSVVDGHPISVHANFVDWSYVGSALGYSVAYIAAVLVGAMVLFSRRDFV